MKTGVIDVGGGLRGIYGAGVLDQCLEDGVHFDVGIGVSAGSANVASCLAGQKDRNYSFYHDYSFRKEYMSLGELLRHGNYLNMEYIYGTLSNSDGENPLDYAALASNPAHFFVVAEEAATGRARYFTKEDFSQDCYKPFMASCNIPVINRPYVIDGIGYYDGGLADPVPVDKALAEGCDRLVVILTRPLETQRSSRQDEMLAKLLRRRYPASAEGLMRRAERYNRSVDKAKELARQGRAIIVAPKSIEGMKTLTRDKAALDQLYRYGREDGTAVKKFLENAQ